MARLGAGFNADSGILSASEENEVGDIGSTGCLVDALVEGFMSWAGEGSRFMDADCMVEAMSMAGFDMITSGSTTSANLTLNSTRS